MTTSSCLQKLCGSAQGTQDIQSGPACARGGRTLALPVGAGRARPMARWRGGASGAGAWPADVDDYSGAGPALRPCREHAQRPARPLGGPQGAPARIRTPCLRGSPVMPLPIRNHEGVLPECQMIFPPQEDSVPDEKYGAMFRNRTWESVCSAHRLIGSSRGARWIRARSEREPRPEPPSATVICSNRRGSVRAERRLFQQT